MKVAVVGARPPDDTSGELLQLWMEHLDRCRVFVLALPPGTLFVSGGARGIDSAAELAADARGLQKRIFLPRDHGGPLPRNVALTNFLDPLVDELHAFPWPGCSGTWHAYGLAKKRGVRVVPHYPKGLPKR